MWLYKVPLLSLLVGKLSYIQTLDKKCWLFRQKSASGVKIIQTHPFLETSKIFSLPVHIKAEYQEIYGDCCRYVCIKFPESAIEKLQACILTVLRS